MAQILDPLPSDNSEKILCCYINATSHIQIARITNIPNWYFERVVFPGQRLVFEALPEGLLEIHTGMMATAILSDTIPCERLWVDENGNYYAKSESQPIGNKTTLESVNNKSRSALEPLTLAPLG